MDAILGQPNEGANQPLDVERIYRRDLAGLSVNGGSCESCGRHMHDHEWADLDVNGLVVACPFGSDA